VVRLVEGRKDRIIFEGRNEQSKKKHWDGGKGHQKKAGLGRRPKEQDGHCLMGRRQGKNSKTWAVMGKKRGKLKSHNGGGGQRCFRVPVRGNPLRVMMKQDTPPQGGSSSLHTPKDKRREKKRKKLKKIHGNTPGLAQERRKEIKIYHTRGGI